MKIACVLLVLVGSATVAFAQISVSDFDGLTPVGLQPGSPAGSYALSGLDSVNLYNGSANITIPLLNIGGRGEAGYTMAANYGGRWNGAGILSADAPCSPASPCPLWTFQTSGWANWDYLYRPAGIAIRHLGQGSYTVYSNGYPQCDVYTGALTRITVGLADGTELTLVDAATSGAPMASLNCNPQGSNRGTTFVSTDGSAATFIADSPIYDVSLVGGAPQWEETGAGTLYFRDGR